MDSEGWGSIQELGFIQVDTVLIKKYIQKSTVVAFYMYPHTI